MRKRSKYKPKPIKAPAIRLLPQHSGDLALQAHIAAARLDTPEGVNAFCDILCKATVALESSGGLDTHARRLLGTATKMFDDIIRTNRVTDRQEAYLKQLAGWIDEWCHTRIKYSGLETAKKLMRLADEKILQKSVDM